MKQLTVLLLVTSSMFSACARSPQPVVNTNSSTVEPQRSERSETVIAHTTEDRTPPSANNSSRTGQKSKWTQSGDPIDTREFDAAISAAQKGLKDRPGDQAAKKDLAEAFLKRAVALTDARQYASALGDYRRVLKYDPENREAKNWIEQIIGIYESLGRESPNEGEEPPPLPYKGE